MTLRPLVPEGLRARYSLLFLLGIALLAGSCKTAGGPGGRGGFQMPPMPVEVSPVENRTVRDQFHALGGIQADEVIDVTSEIAGVVRSLPFAEGQPVGRGSLLAELDDRETRADAARASAQRELAASNAARAAKLAEQDLISQQSLDDARTTLKIAEADEAQAAARLDKTRIRAPWAGLAGRRRVSIGAYVKSGDPITELSRVNEVRVQFSAPERYMGQLKPGIPVEVTTPAFPERVFVGRLSVVDPNIDAETRSVQLIARVPNPQHLLKSGMSGNVSVTFSQRANALMVPDEAVIAEGNQNFVYVVKADSSVTKAPVELGVRDSSRVEIVRGLQAGQQVVRAGHQKIFEGAHVMPVSEGAMAAGMGPGGPGGAAPAKPAPAKPAPAGSGERGKTGKAAGGSTTR